MSPPRRTRRPLLPGAPRRRRWARGVLPSGRRAAPTPPRGLAPAARHGPSRSSRPPHLQWPRRSASPAAAAADRHPRPGTARAALRAPDRARARRRWPPPPRSAPEGKPRFRDVSLRAHPLMERVWCRAQCAAWCRHLGAQTLPRASWLWCFLLSLHCVSCIASRHPQRAPRTSESANTPGSAAPARTYVTHSGSPPAPRSTRHDESSRAAGGGKRVDLTIGSALLPLARGARVQAPRAPGTATEGRGMYLARWALD